VVQAKSETPISKIASGKRAGGVAQAIEHLPRTHKALSSNPRTATKKKTELDLDIRTNSIYSE
jgi:hypothetical protein